MDSALPEEACIFVFFHQRQKVFDSSYLGHRAVLVPPQICPLPVNQPLIPRSQVPSLRDSFFEFLSRVIPPRPDFEKFDTPSVEAEAEINLVSNVSGRTTLLDKRRNDVLDALFLDVVQSDLDA
jgi:hypothetical protein